MNDNETVGLGIMSVGSRQAETSLPEDISVEILD